MNIDVVKSIGINAVQAITGLKGNKTAIGRNTGTHVVIIAQHQAVAVPGADDSGFPNCQAFAALEAKNQTKAVSNSFV